MIKDGERERKGSKYTSNRSITLANNDTGHQIGRKCNTNTDISRRKFDRVLQRAINNLFMKFQNMGKHCNYG